MNFWILILRKHVICFCVKKQNLAVLLLFLQVFLLLASYLQDRNKMN